MSASEQPDIQEFVQRYTQGDDAERYLRFIDEVLGVGLSEPQAAIVRTVSNYSSAPALSTMY